MRIAIATLLTAFAAWLVYLYLVDAPDDGASRQVSRVPASAPEAALDNAAHTPTQSNHEDDGTEVVLGLRVRKDRNCTVELRDYVTPDGEMFSAYSCTPDEAPPPHPYADYDDETLDVMAYADAEAAALLGKRLIGKDPRKSYRLLIRAAALDGGNIDHITWLSDQAFGTIAVDGESHVANLERSYELAALAARLGDTSTRADYLQHELIKAGLTADQLATLTAHAELLLQSMRETQQTVLGDVTIGGQGDA